MCTYGSLFRSVLSNYPSFHFPGVLFMFYVDWLERVKHIKLCFLFQNMLSVMFSIDLN